MTANSDVDLVFVYGGKFKKSIYINIFKQLIKILSTKTTEGYIIDKNNIFHGKINLLDIIHKKNGEKIINYKSKW